jgi:uncharacterized protein YdaU (DUF1376 family)
VSENRGETVVKSEGKDGAHGSDQTASTPNQSGEEVTQDMAPSKRTPSPAYQHYPSDFLSDDKVCRMSYTEIGIYQVLLDHAWLAGGLPTKHGEIAKMLKMNPRRFSKVWAGALSECWIERGGRLVNPRQEKERTKQREYSRRQSDRAAHGWQSRKDAAAMPGQCQERHPSGNASLSHSHSQISKNKNIEEGLDVAFREFQESYPAHRRKGGHLVEVSFMDQAAKAGGSAALLEALGRHKVSEQWANSKLIPAMDRWLSEEMWRQTLAPKSNASGSHWGWKPAEAS